MDGGAGEQRCGNPSVYVIDVSREWSAPLGISDHAYCTLGLVEVFTAPPWACHSVMSCPSPLNARCTWFTMLPLDAAS